MPGSIFLPAAVLALWTVLNIFRLGLMRVSSLRRRDFSIKYYRTYDGDSPEPQRLRQAGRHVQNLFEGPPIFYAASIIAHLADAVDALMLGLAWGYVGLRIIHSFIHLGGNDVTRRFYVFASSTLVLGIMWALIAVRLM